MGRIRKFTQEAYDALQSGVSDDGEILDFFSDIPLNISNFFNSLELEDDLSNFQSYLRDISDFENYTAKKIDDIFRDVPGILKQYGVEVIGVDLEAIARGEDRIIFKETMDRIEAMWTMKLFMQI